MKDTALWVNSSTTLTKFSGLVIVQDTMNLKSVEEVARAHAILTNDALIIATSRHVQFRRLQLLTGTSQKSKTRFA